MEVAARSYLMAGVALVGAGAIAAAPIQVLPADVSVPAVASSSASVELNALVNPIELWANVISTAVTNTGAIAETVLENPAPILGKIVGNQLITAEVLTSVATTFVSGFVSGVGTLPQQIEDAIRYGILEGNIYDGLLALATAFLYPVVSGAFGALMRLPDIVAVLQNPFLNAASVIETAVTQGIVGVGLPLLTNLLAPVAQIGLTGQAIYDGVQANDFEAVANAVISFPSDMVNTILNGNPEIGIGGLLGPEGGLVPGLLAFRQAIADSIHPPALVSPFSRSVAEAPDLKAAAVTVDTGVIDGAQSGSADGVAPVADDATADDGAIDDAATDDVVGADGNTAPAASVETVKSSPVIKPERLDFGTKRQGGDTAAVKSAKSLGDNFGKAVKKLGNDVKKALGVKPKKEKESKASADAGTGGEG